MPLFVAHQITRELKPMQVDEAIDYFLRAKRGERKSDQTIEQYSRALTRFAIWYDGYCSPPSEPTVEGIDVPAIRSYISHLQDQPSLKPISVATYIRPIKTFLRFMEGEEMRGPNPFRRVRVPTFDRELHNLLTDADLRALLRTCDLTVNDGRRDYAIMAFLYDTGVRVGELVNLKHGDMDMKGQSAKVFGKGRKERMVFFSPQTAMALTRYTYRQPAKFKSATWLWTSIRHSVGSQFSANGVSQMLRRRATVAGVTSRVNPHTFRHTFATNYLRNGGDLNSLMRLMGHADLTILQTYLSLVNDDLRSKHDQFSPMARAMGTKR